MQVPARTGVLIPLAGNSIVLGMIGALAMKLGATMEFENNGLGLS